MDTSSSEGFKITSGFEIKNDGKITSQKQHEKDKE